MVFAAPMTVRAQPVEDFNDISTLTLADWYFQNNSVSVGTTSWFQGNPGVFPAANGAGNACIAANFENTLAGGTLSHCMLTPVLTLEDDATFSFFTRITTDGGVFPDLLELRLITVGASTMVGNSASSVGDFDQLLRLINPDLSIDGYPDEWTQFSVTLSGIGAPTSGRFGFRYFVTEAGDGGLNSNYIGIDAVSYNRVSGVPEPASVALMGVGLFGLALVRRRRVR